MRHSAVTFAAEARDLVAAGQAWDLVFCSAMLNVAEYRGLAPRAVREQPVVVYFHENQLTYPVQFESERDYHFGYTNMTSALAATSAWFNSRFNRDSFLTALPAFLKRMPDNHMPQAPSAILAKSRIESPGIQMITPRAEARRPGPARLLWAARWEHDKNPGLLFDALRVLKKRGLVFRVSVIGEQFEREPPEFAAGRRDLAEFVDLWGFQPTRAAYEDALRDADVFVSTADHEFFGITAAEAMLAGCYPMLPNRLAYPELLEGLSPDAADAFVYEGGANRLADRLEELIRRIAANQLWGDAPRGLSDAMARFVWDQRAAALDNALETVAAGGDERDRPPSIG
ncbi:MAG: DUF3524 domain-containing protein [Phycisphaerales bacterium]|nr:DUF3524 domain-containing protein [Phycisphaerales bacterium]